MIYINNLALAETELGDCSNAEPLFKRALSLSEKLMAKTALISPMRALLGDAKQLLVSPAGGLNLIPFEALIDERNRYLIKNYSFTYLTSGRDLLRMQTLKPH